MGAKFTAIRRLITSRKFVLLTVPKSGLLLDVTKGGSEELSANILIMTKILSIYEETKQTVTEQAADAGQLRNLQAITEAVRALESSDDVRQ